MPEIIVSESVSHQPSPICLQYSTSPFCPPEQWWLIWGTWGWSCQSLLAKASDKTDGLLKSITSHNITHFVNKWICFDSMCMSDRVTCSLPIWTSSLSLPKHTVIYGSWALCSCVLWCLIQGLSTREGGERGCVGNSPGLGSPGTLISYKYSLCCLYSSPSLWLLWSNSVQALCVGNIIGLRTVRQVDHTKTGTIKSVWCIMSLGGIR